MLKSKGDEGLIQHMAAVRYRVTGTGVLRTTLFSLQDVEFQPLANLTMAQTTNIQPVILSSFRSQGIQIDVRTVTKDAQFDISKIVAYIKPVAAAYPQ